MEGGGGGRVEALEETMNLYGWTMSNYLPYEGFKYLKNVGEFDVIPSGKKSKIGFILEVDLEYP